ncbi:MAG: PadR family transcriptional regulator [Flavobacteriaceae bacterium]
MTSELLHSWEETNKKGQLTLWIFLSLRDGEKYVDEIKSFIEKISRNTFSCEEQSIYRSLRKYLHLGIVEFDFKKGNKGPERKYYKLTELGNDLLDQFIDRNINLFFEDTVVQLLKKKM